ncbi:MAG: hypothetical protein K2X03_28695 [Bryobacteraceae bacterium]|nr:hypothetical protein [Bryobacteraceae bacterium]
MAARKKAARPIEEILAKQMVGHEPPSADRLRVAVQASVTIGMIAPWTFLQDSNCFAFDSASGQRWYGLVMGALEEVFAFQAYRGSHGYALMRDIYDGRLKDSSEFHRRQDLFTVEFVPRVELSAADRAILALVPGIPAGMRVPQLTVSRPRHHRWYPHADDLQEMIDGLMSLIQFLTWLKKNPGIDPWEKLGQIPLINAWRDQPEVTMIPEPPPPAAVPDPPAKLDEREINALLKDWAKRKPGPALEVGVYLFPSPVGKPSGPFFPWTALACDSHSGYVFLPEMGDESETSSEALVACALRALQQAPLLRPEAFHVIDEAALLALEPLALALGIPLQVTEIPAVEQAHEAMIAHLG